MKITIVEREMQIKVLKCDAGERWRRLAGQIV
jgi:hypothetical protein